MLKTRPELEAEAMRLIRVVNENIVLDAKEVLVRALDQMQVDAFKAAAEIAYQKTAIMPHYSNPERFSAGGRSGAARDILQALENRENI